MAVDQNRNSWLSISNWIPNLPKWCPTSMEQLIKVELKILSNLRTAFQTKFVPICNNQKQLWTLTANTTAPNVPLVMVHGMGGGIGLWALNVDSIAQKRPFYAFDLMGFGQSSRPQFSKDAKVCEVEFVQSIEEWRKEMKLDKFVLLGHSLGGFLASSYTMKHPEHVQHLILVDSWGFPEKPPESERQYPIPTWVKIVASVLQPFNPLAVLRAAGPWGPGLVSRFRPDFKRKFSSIMDDETIFEYIYHCNAQAPSGEEAFKALSIPFGWAKNPMVNRINEIPENVPITMIYGSRSWVDSNVGYKIKFQRKSSYVDVQIIKGAGHHVYADKAEEFNTVIDILCTKIDKEVLDGEQVFTSQVINEDEKKENLVSEEPEVERKNTTPNDSSNVSRPLQSRLLKIKNEMLKHS